MADILTHLRELSVGFYFFNKKSDEITPTHFLSIIKHNIKNTDKLKSANISSEEEKFNNVEMSTIENGLRLGRIIKDKFKIKDNPNIIWSGLMTQSDSVVDLAIDEIKFSLKEESFIIENMGLYKLINLLIGKDKYSLGQLHAFEDFAKQELEEWFSITRDLVIENQKGKVFVYSGRDYISTMRLKNYILEMNVKYSDGRFYESILTNFFDCKYDKFKRLTTGETREHVFSKFINEKLSKNESYCEAKEKCSKVAGKAIIKLIEEGKGKLTNLKRFFRIEKDKYYYAKTTNRAVNIFEVPSSDKFESIIEVKDLDYKVPKSQLNIYTTIRNVETKEEIKFRSEVRYTHGQLNNAPEAKSYVEKGDLTVAYKKVYNVNN